jgi:hypothetical protein
MGAGARKTKVWVGVHGVEEVEVEGGSHVEGSAGSHLFCPEAREVLQLLRVLREQQAAAAGQAASQ